ncbi:MAG: aminotransferase class IV, partial [Salinibacter sp.]
VEDEEGTMGLGSGIVWDSNPAAEYEECALKGAFLTQKRSVQVRAADPEEDLKLIETMRYDGVQIPLLERHVERLARSAAYFSFPFDGDRFRRRVERAVMGCGGATLKVRATLDRWGGLEVTTTPIEEPTEQPWRLGVAEVRVDRDDPFFYHKTTRRHVYEKALENARCDGYDEALLLNQDGEVTEGTYSNLFVQSGEKLFTPPVASGLLAGVYRDHVLETRPKATERVLTLDDLRAADALYCCNAVRGWCEAVLEGPVLGGP